MPSIRLVENTRRFKVAQFAENTAAINNVLAVQDYRLVRMRFEKFQLQSLQLAVKRLVVRVLEPATEQAEIAVTRLVIRSIENVVA